MEDLLGTRDDMRVDVDLVGLTDHAALGRPRSRRVSTDLVQPAVDRRPTAGSVEEQFPNGCRSGVSAFDARGKGEGATVTLIASEPSGPPSGVPDR
jgi:hypothetical protein